MNNSSHAAVIKITYLTVSSIHLQTRSHQCEGN